MQPTFLLELLRHMIFPSLYAHNNCKKFGYFLQNFVKREKTDHRPLYLVSRFYTLVLNLLKHW